MRLIIATAIVGLLCRAVAGADPSAEPARAAPREVYVPANQPSVWPKGRWLARPTAEYRRMLADFANQQPAPPRATLSRATYTATFAGHSFNGRFHAEVELRGSEPAYLSLGVATLALHQLVWTDHPAVWGLTPSGRHVVRVHADGSELEGRWSLRGRELFGRTEFDVTLPPAVISTLELRLPVSMDLTASGDVGMDVTMDSIPGWRRWRLILGQEHRLHIAVSEEPDRAAPLWALVERESHYSLMPDGLSLEAVFHFDNLGKESEQLMFAGTSGMEVTSVVVGTERELPFQRSQDEQRAFVEVPVSSLSGRGRVSVRVLGKMPLPDEGSWTLPRISLKAPHETVTRSADEVSSEADDHQSAGGDDPDGQIPRSKVGDGAGAVAPFDVVSSRSYVTVHRPLELRDFSVVDCRLISSTIVRQQSDRLEFEDWSNKSQITVTWDVPRADLIADVITAVSGDHLQPTSRTLLQLTTRSGSTYELSCRIPAHWQVTHVTSEPWHRSQRISSWRTQPAEDGSAKLLMEFRDALKPGDPVFVEIGTTRLAGDASTANSDVWLTPQVAELGRVHLAVQPTGRRQVLVPPASSFRPTNAARVRDDWSHAIGDWDRWLRDSFGRTSTVREPLYFVAENPSEMDVQLVPAGEATRRQETTGKGTDASSWKSNAIPLAAAQHESGDRRTARRTLTADVAIRTRVPADPGQPALQTAHYRIDGERFIDDAGAGAELTFELTAPGELISATLNGSNERVALMDGSVHLDMPAGVESHLIAIHYRTPFSQSLLWGAGEIPLPRADLVVTNLRWEIESPDSFRVRSSTDGTAFPSRPFGWRERLLGPLAREAAPPAMQQQRVSSEQQTQDAERTAPFDASATIDSPPGATPESLGETPDAIHRRSLPFTAHTLRLGIWNEDRARHLGWVLLVVAFLTIGFAGRLPSRWGVTIQSAALAATALTAIVVPESLAVPCGGLFFGTLTGAVLPRGLVSRHGDREGEPQSLGTTRIVARALTPLLVLVLGLCTEMHAFQVDDSPTVPIAATPQSETAPTNGMAYDAMIPVHSGSPTLEESPVVYVSPSLLARWHVLKASRLETPPYLIREARYVVSGRLGATPRVAAVFDVLRLDQTANRIALPLTEITIDDNAPCRVNGRKASVIPMQGGAGIVVELPSAPAVDDGVDGQSEPDPDDEQTLRIELGFRPDAIGSMPPRQLQFTIPPVFASTAEVRDGSDDAERIVVNGFGSTTVSGADGHVVAELGPVGRLEIVEDDAHASSDATPWIPDLALSSIELHPRRLSVRARLRFRVDAAAGMHSPSVLEVLFPAKAAVTEVNAPYLIKSNVQRVPGEPTQLQLAFAEIPANQVDVGVAFTLPAAYSEKTARIPEFPYFERIPSRSSAGHMVAITPSAGFRVAAAATEFLDEWLTPAPVAQFKQLWDDAQAIDPVRVFSLEGPHSFPLEITPVLPVREASVVETLALDRAQFQWNADIELEYRSAPVAVHRFHVDPRVQITAVRVVQEGLERHIRWIRDEESALTVLLSDDLVGSQSIFLEGNLPAVLNLSVDIPRLRLPKMTLLHHELRLQRPPGWSVEVFGEDGLAMRPADAVRTNQQLSGERSWSFDFNSETPPQRIRVSENLSPFDFERIVSLHATQTNQMRLRTLFRLGEGRPLPPRIEFVIPTAWTPHSTLTTQPELLPAGTRADGSAVLVLDTHGQRLPSGCVEFAATLPTPLEGPWTIPTIEAVGGSPTRELLVLSGEARLDVAGDVRIASLNRELLQTIRLPDESDSMHRRTFVLPAPKVERSSTDLSREAGRVKRDGAEETSTDPAWTILPTPRFSAKGHVRHTESSIWDVPQFGVVGITSAVVTLHHGDDVIVDLPSQLELVLALWDGVPISLPPEGHASLKVPAALVSSHSAPHHVSLWWKQAGAPLQFRRTVSLPRIAELPVISETVAFLGSERMLYEAGAAWTPVADGDLRISIPQAEPQQSPVATALSAAGTPDPARLMESRIRMSAAILRGQIDPDEGQTHSEVTVWRLRRDWQRGLLAVLLSLLVLILSWKIMSSPMLHNKRDLTEIRAFAGPLVLAIMLWTMGPPMIGLCLVVLVSAAWVGAVWRRRVADSTFEVDSGVASSERGVN